MRQSVSFPLSPRSEREGLFLSFPSTADDTRCPDRLESELALLSAAEETKLGKRRSAPFFFQTLTGPRFRRRRPRERNSTLPFNAKEARTSSLARFLSFLRASLSEEDDNGGAKEKRTRFLLGAQRQVKTIYKEKCVAQKQKVFSFFLSVLSSTSSPSPSLRCRRLPPSQQNLLPLPLLLIHRRRRSSPAPPAAA